MQAQKAPVLTDRAPGNATLAGSSSVLPNTHSQTSNSEIKENVVLTLSYLTTLAISIRRSGTQYRDLRAERFAESSHDFQTTKAEMYDFLLSIRLSGIFKEYRTTTEGFLGGVEFTNPVFQRLVDCNMKRWSKFRYARHHDKSLSAVPHESNTENVRTPDVLAMDTITGQTPPSVPQESSEAVGKTSASIEPEGTTVSKLSTTATPIERGLLQTTLPAINESHSGSPMPHVAGSFVAGRLRLKYPQPPKVDASSKHFQCSCCRQLLPVEFAEQENWRFVLSQSCPEHKC